MRPLLEDEENELWFSAVSIWEVAIKQGLKRADFPYNANSLRRRLLESGFLELPVTGNHATAIAMLPSVHKDPFDRLLVAQATVEGLVLYTSDTAMAAYGGLVRKM